MIQQTSLIADGLQLMLIGMSMVFIFLSFLVFCTSFMHRVLKESDSQEASSVQSGVTQEETAAITAAIHTYRHQKNS